MPTQDLLLWHRLACVLQGNPPYDAKRTLLTTGIFDYVLRARGEGTGAVFDTPELAIEYISYCDTGRVARNR